MQELYIRNQAIKLDSKDLIQTGGEGMVFGWGNEAVKIYHAPNVQLQAKLDYILSQGLADRLPPNVYAPQTAVHDANHKVIGFTMPRLPQRSQPVKKLSNAAFCQQHAITVKQILALLLNIHATLGQLHALGIIVGDLNDHNLYFTLENTAALHPAHWIDVDSYQIGGFPCPVALQSFLDPTLYTITDFAQQSSFSQASDWYAFTVLVVKCLLHTHPYGGAHHHHKSLQARAVNHISVLHPAVVYPRQARPPTTLPDSLLDHILRIFEGGERPPFPAQLLYDFAAHLAECHHCGLAFDGRRRTCPACQQATPAPPPPQAHLTYHTLFETEGFVEHVWIPENKVYRSHGRLYAIVQRQGSYWLVHAGIGGLIRELPLFAGKPGYDFRFFGHSGNLHLVVNPPGEGKLLVLELSGQEPQVLVQLTTEQFGATAAYATTPSHLYRVAHGFILRGTATSGTFTEEIVAMAHQNQTRLWGSAIADDVAALFRSFGRYHLLVRWAAGNTHEWELPLAVGASLQEMHVAFSETAIAVHFQTLENGQLIYRSVLADVNTTQLTPIPCPPYTTPPTLMRQTILYATDEGILKVTPPVQRLVEGTADLITSGDNLLTHPQGVLIVRPNSVVLATG